MNRSTLRALLCAATAALATLGASSAEDYPTRPVRVIVPYPPGGGTDVLARLVGRHLTEAWRQPIVIENQPGGTGLIGLQAVARSSPDGYTLMAVAAGPLDENNLTHFAPVALFASPPYLLVVHPAVPASTVPELLAHAKGQPGKLAYGSTGSGSASHLSTELFKAMAGIDLLHVPYKGVGQAVTDLIGGQVQLMIGPSQALMQHVKGARLKALGVTSTKRLATAPELPTIAESGVPGYEAVGWFGLVAPAGTPRPLIVKLNQDVNRILASPEVRERLFELGVEPAGLTPDEFLAFIRNENAKWDNLTRERGIVIERPALPPR
jgi:tripartite-type tricarboxylate transporter receptor subunit TctC